MIISETAPCLQSRTTALQLQRFADCLFDPGDIVELRMLPSRKSTWLRADELSRQAHRLILANQAGQTTYCGTIRGEGTAVAGRRMCC
jgi:hypothetical protein